jgi:putative ABC transport system permease protein
MVAVAMPAILAPTLAASRRTIVSFKAERARDTRPPFWQRLYLDFLLLIPALYGYRQLQLQGSISVPGVAAPSDDPFRNPLLLLAPTLMIFALALVSLRAIPLVLSVLAALFDRLPGISLLMALRSLSRTSKVYSGLILLIVLTLSLATFTASMARTLDAHALARATYSTGADIRILDRGTQLVVARPNEVAPIPIPPISQGGAVPGAPVREALPAGSYRYSFMPLDEYLSYSGVEAVTRIGRSKVSVTGDASREGTFIGVDRLTLPQVIQEGWQPSYAAESLGALMNLLGEVPSGVLISERHAAEYGLKRGDRIKLDMNEFGQVASVPLIVVGVINYFPTVYPEDGAFFVGNLDYAFDMQGGAYPHEIWMQTTPEAHVEDIIKANISRGMNTTAYERPEDQLEETLLRPERQGLFGLLSVGFLALVLVSVVGFLVYTLRSFQRRLVEMGILRAIGLTVTQLATLLICEQALVIGAGTVFGTLIGVSVSRLFMPFLQVRSDQHPDTPPFVVQIAWDQIALVYLAVGGLLLVTVCVTLVLLRRMRIFEAVKLGEAV